MVNQEMLMKMSLYDQQMKAIQQQLEAVEQAMHDISELNLGLDEFKNSKDKEIMAHVGRGIFVKAKVISDDLIVDVGDKNFVKKSVPESQKLIESQIEKLSEFKKDLGKNLENINSELMSLIEDFEKESK